MLDTAKSVAKETASKQYTKQIIIFFLEKEN